MSKNSIFQAMLDESDEDIEQVEEYKETVKDENDSSGDFYVEPSGPHEDYINNNQEPMDEDYLEDSIIVKKSIDEELKEKLKSTLGGYTKQSVRSYVIDLKSNIDLNHENFKKEIRDLTSEKISLKKEVSYVNKLLADRDNTIESLEADVKRLAESEEELTSQITNTVEMKERLNHLEDRVSYLDSENKNLLEKNDSLVEIINSLEKELMEKREKISESENCESNEKDEDIDESESNLDEKIGEDKIDELIKENQKLKDEINMIKEINEMNIQQTNEIGKKKTEDFKTNLRMIIDQDLAETKNALLQEKENKKETKENLKKIINKYTTGISNFEDKQVTSELVLDKLYKELSDQYELIGKLSNDVMTAELEKKNMQIVTDKLRGEISKLEMQLTNLTGKLGLSKQENKALLDEIIALTETME